LLFLLQHHRPHIHQLHIQYQSPAAGIASPWKLPSTVKSAQHSLNTPSVGAFRSLRALLLLTHLPAAAALLLLFIHQYHYHLLITSPSTATWTSTRTSPPPLSSALRLTLARPARLHSNSSSRCATETSASLLRQIPAVLPFFTLDGPDICCPGMLQQDTPSPPSPSPSPHTLALLSCRTHVSNRTPEPPSRSAIGVRFPIHRHPPHPFAIESHLPSRTLHALVRPRPRRETRY
jgi:hypothetical protein